LVITQHLLASGASVTWWDRDTAAQLRTPRQHRVGGRQEGNPQCQHLQRRKAAMLLWLCTEECSFSTAAVFDLSGGRATY